MSMQEMLNPHSISRKFFFLKQATEANNRYKLHGKIEICFYNRFHVTLSLSVIIICFFVVGIDNFFHKAVAHDVVVVELDDGDAFDVAQDAGGVGQAGVLPVGEVDLAYVAGDDEFGVDAHAGEEHFELVAGGVLRLVEDDEGVVEGASPHVGEGCDLYDFRLEVLRELPGRNHVGERVVERLEVGVDFFFHVAGEESEVFSRFHRRPAEDDAFYLFVAECFHGDGDGGVCFSGARGACDEEQVVRLHGLDEGALVGGARADDFPVVAEHDNRGWVLRILDGVVLQDDAFEVGEGEHVVFVVVLEEGVDFGDEQVDVFFLALDDDFFPPRGDFQLWKEFF